MIFCYCKVECITKYDNFYYKAKQVVSQSGVILWQSGAGTRKPEIFITNWGRHYKLG